VIVLAGLTGSRIAFYATVATVLPIILIAFGLQFRARNVLLSSRPAKTQYPSVANAAARVTILTGWSYALIMCITEFLALQALGEGNNDNYMKVSVGASFALVLLAIGTLDAVTRQLAEAFAGDRKAREAARAVQADEAMKRVLRDELYATLRQALEDVED
jgi:hypothetical protein